MKVGVSSTIHVPVDDVSKLLVFIPLEFFPGFKNYVTLDVLGWSQNLKALDEFDQNKDFVDIMLLFQKLFVRAENKITSLSLILELGLIKSMELPEFERRLYFVLIHFDADVLLLALRIFHYLVYLFLPFFILNISFQSHIEDARTTSYLQSELHANIVKFGINGDLVKIKDTFWWLPLIISMVIFIIFQYATSQDKVSGLPQLDAFWTLFEHVSLDSHIWIIYGLTIHVFIEFEIFVVGYGKFPFIFSLFFSRLFFGYCHNSASQRLLLLSLINTQVLTVKMSSHCVFENDILIRIKVGFIPVII